jgi:hypothetical protein
MGVMGGNMSTTNDLTAALADLAKPELAFTTDIRSDGKTTYVVDSVALAEEELVLLHGRGALTQEGIRHHLVYRGGNGIGPILHIPVATFSSICLRQSRAVMIDPTIWRIALSIRR